MTGNEAHAIVMAAVEELQASGIKVKVTPVFARPSTLRKYGGGGERAIPEKWCCVDFFPTTQEQWAAILKAGKQLSWRGIHFDTGGCVDRRNWELDWSLRATGTPNGDYEAGMSGVEDVIQGMEQS